MNPLDHRRLLLTRRHFFGRSAAGIGTAALASLLNPDLFAGPPALPQRQGRPGVLPATHFPARAKRVIYLFMSGGPSHIDLLDHKPALRRHHGQELPASVRMGQRVTGMTAGQSSFPCAASLFRFQQHGQSGTWLSELLPHTASVVDDIAVVKSMHTEAINHDPAILDGVGELNRLASDEIGDPEIQTRIAQYEMAFRMQTSVPELTDLSSEPAYVRRMYGLDRGHDDGGYARNCLLARRMAERGVRFIQLMHRGWDQHGSLPSQIRGQCLDV